MNKLENQPIVQRHQFKSALDFFRPSQECQKPKIISGFFLKQQKKTSTQHFCQ